MIPPGGTVEGEVGVVALCAGVFEVGVTVDEVEVLKSEEGSQGHGGEGARARSDTQTLLQGVDVLGDVGLRTWHVREACVVVAKRAD